MSEKNYQEMEIVYILKDLVLDFNNPDKSGNGYVEFYVNPLQEPSFITEYPAGDYVLLLDGDENYMNDSQDGSTMWKIWMGPSNKNLASLIIKKDGSAPPTLRIRTDGGVQYDSFVDEHLCDFILYREPTPTKEDKRAYAIHDFVETDDEKLDIQIIIDATMDGANVFDESKTTINVYVDDALFKSYKLTGGE